MAILRVIPVQSRIIKDKTNCYVIGEKNKNVIIIDPGAEPVKIINLIRDIGGNPIRILLTHGHPDHWMAIHAIRQKWGMIPISIHEKDANLFAKSYREVEYILNVYQKTRQDKEIIEKYQVILNKLESMKNMKPDSFLMEGKPFFVNDMQLEFLYTPGHSDGSICIYTTSEHDFDNIGRKRIIFTGDLVFNNNIGINQLVELHGGDRYIIWTSLVNQIIRNKNISEDILICPGHSQSLSKRKIKHIIFMNMLQYNTLWQ